MRRLYISQIIAFINLVKRTKPDNRRTLSVLRVRSQSLIIHGFIPEYKYLLEIAEDLGLIFIRKKRIYLREHARELISEIDQDHYMLTKLQKLKFADLIFRAKGRTAIRLMGIYEKFRYSKKRKSYILDIRILQGDELDLIYIMINSGILSELEGVYIIEKDYEKNVRKLKEKDNEKISAAKLELILRAQKDIGKKAEIIAMAHERERLKSLGRIFESEMISLISDEDVSAGYDIASFDGDFPTVEHDRFIEVKGSTSGDICYYISNNELNKAKELGEKYWLYYVSLIDKKSGGKLIKIPNFYCHFLEIKDTASKPLIWRIKE